MSAGWEQLVDAAIPLAGVLTGALLTRAASRQAFVRDQSMTEVTYRRERFATYQKAVWAYAARVKVARDLVAAEHERVPASQAAARPGRPPPYDMVQTKQRQEACRDAIADLRMFASTDTQDAAWAAMEALSESFNVLVSDGDRVASDAAFQAYEKAFTQFATALNRELVEINYMLYAYQTPLWRAVLNKVRGKPLEFAVAPSGDPGTPLTGPAEDQTTIK